jgi:hypothetical protein
MPEVKNASKLIGDLTRVPNIVGALGLSIAAAQKLFNADYLENVERILAMTLRLAGAKKAGAAAGETAPLTPAEQAKHDEFAALFKELLTQLAPPRYQYTETTLSVKLDLAQTMDLNATVGLGLGFGGVAVNAALTVGYGYDYRAAAECKSVIHAIPADQTVWKDLLARAGKLGDSTLSLPPQSQIEQSMLATTERIYLKLVEAKPPQIDTSVQPD